MQYHFNFVSYSGKGEHWTIEHTPLYLLLKVLFNVSFTRPAKRFVSISYSDTTNIITVNP